MMTKRQPRNVLELMVSRVGRRGAFQALSFLLQWAIVCAELGREPENIEEYADWWEVSYATGYRELKRFRTALPEYSYPREFFAAAGYDPTNAEQMTIHQLALVPLPGVA